MTEWACAEAVQEEHMHHGREYLNELIVYTINSPAQAPKLAGAGSNPASSSKTLCEGM